MGLRAFLYFYSLKSPILLTLFVITALPNSGNFRFF